MGKSERDAMREPERDVLMESERDVLRQSAGEGCIEGFGRRGMC